MTTYLEMCSNRVAALRAATAACKDAFNWLDGQYHPRPLLYEVLDAYWKKQDQALKEALEFEEFARSQEDEP